MKSTTRPIIANVERLNELMDRDELHAVVLRSGSNFTYLAGFDYAGTLARHLDFSDSPRGVFVVWPRHGDPVMVLNTFAAPRAERDSWLDQIVVFDDYGESRVAFLGSRFSNHAPSAHGGGFFMPPAPSLSSPLMGAGGGFCRGA